MNVKRPKDHSEERPFPEEEPDIWDAVTDHGGNVNYDVLSQCLSVRPDLSKVRRPGGEGFLHLAAYHGRCAVIELLLHSGADVNARNNVGETPLLNAVGGGHYEAAKLLLEAGADPEAITTGGWNPLMRAICLGPSGRDILNLLLSKGVHVDLASAIELGRYDEVWDRLQARPNAVRDDRRANDVLVAAIRSSRPIGLVGLLLEHGADPNAVGTCGETPLCWACRYRNDSSVEVIRLLLQHGADRNCVCSHGMSPMKLATRRVPGFSKHPCHAEVVALLKSKKH